MIANVARATAGAVIAVALGFGFIGIASAQDVRISNDGPNVTSSAAGADNVRVERNPGRQQAVGGDGVGNRVERRQAKRERDRNKNDRGGGNEVAAAPEAAPVDEGGQQEAWAPESDVPAGGSESKPVKLPSTGVGEIGGLLPLAAIAGAVAAGALGTRRLQRD
ncbi:MAG: hypothetical protein IT337_14990 [Thermomicrobiales bacterium]|nr:hypothetical protein [Thermomicrobiales bacterium]